MMTCATCCFKDATQEACRLLRIEIDSSKDVCPKHKFSCEECASCHVLISKGGFIITLNDAPALVCPNCLARLPQESYTNYEIVEE